MVFLRSNYEKARRGKIEVFIYVKADRHIANIRHAVSMKLRAYRGYRAIIKACVYVGKAVAPRHRNFTWC